MKYEWVIKLFMCCLLGGVSSLILPRLPDDSLLVCIRQSDRQIDCAASQINVLGKQHNGQEIINLKKASLEFFRRSNGRLSSASRVLLTTVQEERVPLSSVYTSSGSQPEPAVIVAQVNQFLQSQESRLEISVIHMPRFFFNISNVATGAITYYCYIENRI